MSTAGTTLPISDPYRLGHRAPNLARGHGGGGPASKRVIVGYGFWLFLLSDIVIFSCLFATYAVLAPATAGGPAARDIFDLNRVALETACLLASSFFCGLATIAVAKRNQILTQAALIATGVPARRATRGAASPATSWRSVGCSGFSPAKASSRSPRSRSSARRPRSAGADPCSVCCTSSPRRSSRRRRTSRRVS